MVTAILTLRTDGVPERGERELVEELSARCWALGCRGIEERDGSIMVAFDDPERATTAAAMLADCATGPPEPVADPLAGWRAPMEPVSTGPFRVQPADAESTADEDTGILLSIDPGRAFGSGSHPSTRAVLALLGDLRGQGPVRGRVLDVGTGTGVLAVAAARLGAVSVRAVDMDPAAVATAKANVARNEVADTVTVDQVAIEDPGGGRDETYDLVLVNLTIDGHETVAASVLPRLGESGSLIASGVLVGGQETRLQDCYPDLEVEARRRIDGWAGLRMTRRQPRPALATRTS